MQPRFEASTEGNITDNGYAVLAAMEKLTPTNSIAIKNPIYSATLVNHLRESVPATFIGYELNAMGRMGLISSKLKTAISKNTIYKLTDAGREALKNRPKSPENAGGGNAAQPAGQASRAPAFHM